MPPPPPPPAAEDHLPPAHSPSRPATILSPLWPSSPNASPSSCRAGDFKESQTAEVKFPDINSKVLEKTVQYFYYKLKYTNHQGQLPEFKIEPEYALELLMAANYLDS